MIALAPARSHLRCAAGTAGPADGQARHVAQDVGHIECLALLNLECGDRRYGRSQTVFRDLSDAGSGDDDLFDSFSE